MVRHVAMPQSKELDLGNLQRTEFDAGRPRRAAPTIAPQSLNHSTSRFTITPAA